MLHFYFLLLFPVFSILRPSRKLHMQMQPSYFFFTFPSPHALKPCFVCLFPWTPWEEVQRQVQMSLILIQIWSNWTEARAQGDMEPFCFLLHPVQLLVPDLFFFSCVYVYSVQCVCGCKPAVIISVSPPPSYKCGAIFSPDHIFLFFFSSSLLLFLHQSKVTLLANSLSHSFASSSFPFPFSFSSIPFPYLLP